MTDAQTDEAIRKAVGTGEGEGARKTAPSPAVGYGEEGTDDWAGSDAHELQPGRSPPHVGLISMKRIGVVPLLAALQVVPLATVQAQGDQHTLARRILSGNVADQSHAVSSALTLGPQATGPEVRAALITLLERNNRILDEAARRNVALATLVPPEFVAQVAEVVSQLEDPQAIPALAGALGSGSTLVPDALADFGDRAAAPVLRVVTSANSRKEAVPDGLLALRFMVEGRGARPLSAGVLSEIRRAAKRRLTGKQYDPTLWKAIDLAVVLGDVELRRIVEALAADRGEVVARGIEYLGSIEYTQKLAAGRLAGERPRPWYRTPAERARALGLPQRGDDGPPVIVKPR